MTAPAQLTEAEIQVWKARIDRMDHLKMARLYRHAPIGHVVFHRDLSLHTYSNRRFEALGGMTFEIKCQLSPVVVQSLTGPIPLEDGA